MYTDIKDNDARGNTRRSKLDPAICVIDAKARSERNKRLHSAANAELAATVKLLAEAAYTRSKVYLNFRERFITVKVDCVDRRDLIEFRDKVSALVTYCEAYGIELKSHNTHLLLHIK